MAKVELKPDAEGNLIVPREVLGEVAEGVTFHVEREGRTIRLEPAKPKLHQIEDPVARAEAVERFLKRIAHKTGVSWPKDHDLRSDIYD